MSSRIKNPKGKLYFNGKYIGTVDVYNTSKFPTAILTPNEENEGLDLLMTVVQLARAGKPYKENLALLKKYAERSTTISDLIQELHRNLSK